MPRHLRSLMDLSPREVARVLELAHACKKHPAAYAGKLAGRSFALVFSKQSTRTRVSFEVGIAQLGGHSMFLPGGGQTGMQMGRGETPADTARVLSRYVQGIVIRWHEQSTIDELAAASSVPVVNALSDSFHPCQALADVMTVEERRGGIAGATVAWSGDGNNVASSWIHAAARFRFRMRLACPETMRPAQSLIDWARAEGADVAVTADPEAAVRDADVVVTDTWVSMHAESSAGGAAAREKLHNQLVPYRVDDRLMSYAKKDAIFMHCLPAHRGEEVTDSVIDGPQSVVWDEAENRLHVQKGILAWCLA